MAHRSTSTGFPKRVVFGFIAGFVATLVFHQLSVALLWTIGVSPFPPFPMEETKPFGVPFLYSLAFWGGVWGILFALADGLFPRGGGYWITAFLLGAILPSAVALLVVFPLKGMPMGGGWAPMLLLTAFLINGAWGIGTGMILKVFTGWFGGNREATV